MPKPGSGTQEDLKTQPKVKKPKMYKVIMHNDHYTTMEFVVEVLVNIFRKPSGEATQLMMEIHKNGLAICGVYTLDIAVTKIQQVHESAQINGFPLRCTYEET